MRDEDFLDDLFDEDEDLFDDESEERKPSKQPVEEVEDEKENSLEHNKKPSKVKKVKKPKPVKEKPNKKPLKLSIPSNKTLSISLASVIMIIVIVFTGMSVIKNEIITKGKVGVKAVKLLYNFKDINELEDNLKSLKSMMTDRCYYSTTVLNADKSLNTYLKFKKNKTTVNIIDYKPGFVLYSLDNPNITSTRIFIFSYRLNHFGEIEEVREFEAIDFYGSSDKVIDEEELDKYIEQWESEN